MMTKSNFADVAELADALASGASPRKRVEVQVLSSAMLFGPRRGLAMRRRQTVALRLCGLIPFRDAVARAVGRRSFDSGVA